MFRALLKKQLLEIFQGYLIDRKSGKPRGKKGLVFYLLLMAFVFGSVGFAFYSMAGGLGAGILGLGQDWLYFALTGLVSIALGVFGSVFNTYSSLYLPKDNEFLLSLPIPPRTLVLARTVGVYAASLLYSAWFWIPAAVAYWVLTPPTVSGIVFPIVLTFLIALFVTVLSCLLGWIVALIAVRTKGKNILTVFIGLFVLAAYYIIYFKVVNSIGEIASHLAFLGDTVQTWLHYAYFLGLAAAGDVPSLLLVAAITLALFAICFLVLCRTFLKFALASASTPVKGAKKRVGFAASSVKKALVKREFKHFFSSSPWMLNGGLGLILMPAAGVFLCIRASALREMLAEASAVLAGLSAALPVLLVTVFGWFLSTGILTPVILSLEGGRLWILQTLPISEKEILSAKEAVAVRLCLGPTVLSGVLFSVALGPDVAETLLFLLCTVLFLLAYTDFGLILDLKHPNFAWTNPTVVVKQSPNVMIALFGGWFFSALVGFGGYFLSYYLGSYAALGILAALFAVLFLLLHRWVMGRGCALFRTL